MIDIQAGAGAPDHISCRYGQSRALFRGPARSLDRPYVVMLGGSATFGKAVPSPFPALVEAAIGVPVVNLGAPNAGPDFYLGDPAVLDVAARADVAVVQIAGVEALSNPFYTVHARRNDRFLAATPALRSLFPEVDFTEIHFTRHLLLALLRTDATRFSVVVRALRSTWIARMQDFLVHLPPRRLLLRLADGPVPDAGDDLDPAAGPLLVDADMLAALRPATAGLVEVILQPDPDGATCAALSVTGIGSAQVSGLPGPAMHRTVAGSLAPRVAGLFRARRLPTLVLDQPA